MRTKLRTAVVAGTPPEASIGDILSYALYAAQGALLDLGPLVKRDRIDLARDYVLGGFETWCGKLHAFPWTASPTPWPTTRRCSASGASPTLVTSTMGSGRGGTSSRR